jgi:hypothetical protein
VPRALLIDPRFCGPPDSGNGGYSCGLVASGLAGPVEVTLRSPPPLGRPLRVEGEDRRVLLDDARLIAEARPAPLALDVPAPPPFAEAAAMSAHYVGHHQHFFPGCFVCGPRRAPGDGLRIFAGREQPGGPVVAPWVPDASVGGEDGLVRPEIVWASLDCPGYFGAAPPDVPPALLGRMTGELLGPVRVGERCVVLGWLIAREGRKLHAGTALYGEDGGLRGRARQIWLTVALPAAGGPG